MNRPKMDHFKRNGGRGRLATVLAAAFAAALMLIAAPTAMAEVTAAPEITATPSNPNTTHAGSTFTYEVGEGETSEAATLRYYCRVYDADAAPPAENAGWGACGTTPSTDPQPGSKTYTQANGNWIFEVAVRETTNINTQGPTATDDWIQDISAPSDPPTITSHPDDPSQLVTNEFEYTSASAEQNLVDRYQCRLNSTEEADWTPCNSTRQIYRPGNGEHAFQVRAGNQIGFSPPSELFTWKVHVPNPDPSVKVSMVAQETWNGSVAAALIDRTENVGDINNDGLDDLSMTSQESVDGFIDVVFSTASGRGNRILGTQSPDEGFRIAPIPGSRTRGTNIARGAGDQNGDGIDDLLVRFYTQRPGLAPPTFVIIYGGFDVSDLPPCPTGPAHCLDVTDLNPDQGYVLTSDVTVGGGDDGPGGFNTGDFDGDGTDDIVFSSSGSGEAWVVRGKPRTGSIKIQDLPDSEVLKIRGPHFGNSSNVLGDLDGDGRDDVYLDADQAMGAATVIYGRPFGEAVLDITNLNPNDGFRIYHAAVSGLKIANVGDVNGDGRPDLGLSLQTSVGTPDSDATYGVFYTPQRGSNTSLIVGSDMDPASGYVVNRGGPNNTALGYFPAQLVGDLDNDGTPDALVAAPNSPVDGQPDTGASYVLFGQNPKPSSPLGVGPSLTPEVGVGLLGERADDRLGWSAATLGDLDADGLTDFAVGAVSASPNGNSSAGSIYIVPGKSLINQVKTQASVAVGNESAVVNAGLSTNNRDSQVWFEYGTTDEYGETTDSVEFEGSNTGDAASILIDGLEKGTTYHYRAVAKNELGLVRYGDDRTFTTTNTDDPAVDPCLVNPGAAGCADYCKANPTAMGCPDYDWCAANPGKCGSGGPSKARLALISTSKKIKVKRGKKRALAVAVVNTGSKAAKGVKVCIKAPKRFVKVKRCNRIGKLASGKSRVIKVRVKVKRKARKGKKLNVTLIAKGKEVANKRTRTRMIVR